MFLVLVARLVTVFLITVFCPLNLETVTPSSFFTFINNGLTFFRSYNTSTVLIRRGRLSISQFYFLGQLSVYQEAL